MSKGGKGYSGEEHCWGAWLVVARRGESSRENQRRVMMMVTCWGAKGSDDRGRKAPQPNKGNRY